MNAKRRAISALVRGPSPSQGSPDPSSTDRPASFFWQDQNGHHTARNGLAQPVLAAAPVQLMHTTSRPPESESGQPRAAAAANTQHIEGGQGGRAQHCRQAAEGCAAIWTRRYGLAEQYWRAGVANVDKAHTFLSTRPRCAIDGFPPALPTTYRSSN